MVDRMFESNSDPDDADDALDNGGEWRAQPSSGGVVDPKSTGSGRVEVGSKDVKADIIRLARTSRGRID